MDVKKIGLNIQAVCDACRHLLDVEIKFPGSAYDFFVFEQSELKEMVKKEGFLCPGFSLFDDNAYVHYLFMCVPFRNVASRIPKDAFQLLSAPSLHCH